MGGGGGGGGLHISGTDVNITECIIVLQNCAAIHDDNDM